jgi:hypothetical protein
MSEILEIVKPYIDDNLLTTSDIVDILNVSRERVRQLIVNKILPPKYILNQNLNKKQYIFEKKVIEEYVTVGKVEWTEHENTDLLSITEINNLLQCPEKWVYEATKNGRLKPSLVAGKNNSLICLYSIEDVQLAWVNKEKDNKVVRESTVKVIENIKKLYEDGFSDSDIARLLDKKQPFIFRLRKGAGLVSLHKKGRPKMVCNNSVITEFSF